MKVRSRQSGFTIVELLVASVIMVIILGALGGLFLSTSKAYRANDKVSALQQNADAAGQLLSYEVELAGYRGSDNSTNGFSSRTFSTPILFGAASIPATTLRITANAALATPDNIAVSYYEDRFTSTSANPTRTSVQFSVDTRNNNLDRHASGETNAQPAVEDVTNLKTSSARG